MATNNAPLVTTGYQYLPGLGLVPVQTLNPNYHVIPTPTSAGGFSNNSISNIGFNLPPHVLSSGVDPHIITGKTVKQYADSKRAYMWFYDISAVKFSKTADKGGQKSVLLTTSSDVSNYQWGFQFIWNPNQWGLSTQVNPSIVPSSADKFSDQSGLFPGSQTLNVSIKLNRVHDMAYLKKLGYKAVASNFRNHYPDTLKGAGSKETAEVQLKMLAERGTMADLEYIYRMINGYKDGKGKPFVNSLGVQTSDLSFLAPTAVGLKLSDTAKYVCWLQSVQITHNMFTYDMIPIDTDVQLSFNVFSTTGLGA